MALYAGRYDEVLLKKAGARVAIADAAVVTVYREDGMTPATLYTDRTKVTEADIIVSNPPYIAHAEAEDGAHPPVDAPVSASSSASAPPPIAAPEPARRLRPLEHRDVSRFRKDALDQSAERGAPRDQRQEHPERNERGDHD